MAVNNSVTEENFYKQTSSVYDILKWQQQNTLKNMKKKKKELQQQINKTILEVVRRKINKLLVKRMVMLPVWNSKIIAYVHNWSLEPAIRLYGYFIHRKCDNKFTVHFKVHELRMFDFLITFSIILLPEISNESFIR